MLDLVPPLTKVNNLIFGRTWVDSPGEMVMTNLTTGDKVVLYFQPCGWFGYDIWPSIYSCICWLFSFSTIYSLTICWKRWQTWQPNKQVCSGPDGVGTRNVGQHCSTSATRSWSMAAQLREVAHGIEASAPRIPSTRLLDVIHKQPWIFAQGVVFSFFLSILSSFFNDFTLSCIRSSNQFFISCLRPAVDWCARSSHMGGTLRSCSTACLAGATLASGHQLQRPRMEQQVHPHCLTARSGHDLVLYLPYCLHLSLLHILISFVTLGQSCMLSLYSSIYVLDLCMICATFFALGHNIALRKVGCSSWPDDLASYSFKAYIFMCFWLILGD